MTTLPVWFQRTSVGQQVLAERAAAETGERERLVAQLAEIRATQLRELPPLQQAIEKKIKSYRKIEKALKAAEGEVLRARGEHGNRSLALDSEQNRVERELRKLGVDPEAEPVTV